MDETKMTPAAKKIHDAVIAEVWTEWIEMYCPAVRMISVPK